MESKNKIIKFEENGDVFEYDANNKKIKNINKNIEYTFDSDGQIEIEENDGEHKILLEFNKNTQKINSLEYTGPKNSYTLFYDKKNNTNDCIIQKRVTKEYIEDGYNYDNFKKQFSKERGIDYDTKIQQMTNEAQLIVSKAQQVEKNETKLFDYISDFIKLADKSETFFAQTDLTENSKEEAMSFIDKCSDEIKKISKTAKNIGLPPNIVNNIDTTIQNIKINVENLIKIKQLKSKIAKIKEEIKTNKNDKKKKNEMQKYIEQLDEIIDNYGSISELKDKILGNFKSIKSQTNILSIRLQEKSNIQYFTQSKIDKNIAETKQKIFTIFTKIKHNTESFVNKFNTFVECGSIIGFSDDKARKIDKSFIIEPLKNIVKKYNTMNKMKNSDKKLQLSNNILKELNILDRAMNDDLNNYMNTTAALIFEKTLQEYNNQKTKNNVIKINTKLYSEGSDIG